MQQTLSIRIAHDRVEAYHEALSQTYKDFQENGQFTDIDFFCHDGRRVSAHRSVLLKFSPKLADLLGRQTCCYCHGRSCDVKHEPFSISLPDEDVSTVLSLLDVLYTGRAYFATRQEYDDLLSLKDSLGIDLPPISFSLEMIGSNGDVVEIESRTTLASYMRKSLQQLEQAPAQDFDFEDVRVGASKRTGDQIDTTSKRARMTETSSADEEDLRLSVLDLQGRRQCPHCQRWYNAKRWYDRHISVCKVLQRVEDPDQEEVDHQEVQSPSEKSPLTSDTGTKACQTCGKVLFLKGGWYTRHVKKCKRQDDAERTDEAIQRKSVDQPTEINISSEDFNQLPERDDNGKEICRGCGKYFRKLGGWHTKHVMNCIGISGNQLAVPKEELTCPKCGKEYSPHCRRFIPAHIKECQGSPNKDVSVHETHQRELVEIEDRKNPTVATDLSQADPKPASDATVLPDFRLSAEEAKEMYERGEFTCLVCLNKFAKREIFKTHLVTHFRSKLQELKPEVLKSGNCDMCDYTVKDRNILFAHIAVKHQIIRNYIPEVVAEALFRKPSQVGASPGLRTSKSSMWVCPVCKESFATKNPLRPHIIKHFRSEIKDRYLSKESPNTCNVCGHTTENSDHLLVHLGWTHGKLRDFLSPVEADAIFGTVKPLEGAERNSGSEIRRKNSGNSIDTKEMSRDDTSESPGGETGSSGRRTTNFDCHICDKSIRKKTDFKYHMFQHFKSKLMEKYFTTEDSQLCPFCDYRASNPEHILVHVGLTHQKICDYLSDDISEMIFGKNRKSDFPLTEEQRSKNETKKNLTVCYRCDKEFDTKDDLKAHLESCVWSCQNCPKTFKDQTAIKKHKELCQAGVRPKAVLACHLCEIEYETLHHINSHYSSHYKSELVKALENSPPTGTGYFVCTLCNFRANSIEALATHKGSKHAVFVQFLPQNVLKSYEDFAKVKRRSSPGEANGHFIKAAEGEKFSCPTCSAEFQFHHQLAHHMTNVNCNPPSRKSNRHSSEDPVRCKVCQQVIGSFLQYKCHLLDHFEPDLDRDWGAKYRADSGKCLECGGSDNYVPGAELGEEGKRSFVVHMALDHDKIFDYLSADIKSHMRTAFDDGTIALPPTPPPPPLADAAEETNASALPVDVEVNEEQTEEIEIQIEAVDDVIGTEVKN